MDEKFNPHADSFSISEGDIPSAMDSEVLSKNSDEKDVKTNRMKE
jgi:hypothetical protein